MYNYNIFPDNSPAHFKEVCRKIEKYFPNAKKSSLLVDVDGTTIQNYIFDNKEIDVYDDYDVGAVFVRSEVDLKELFHNA